MDEAVALPATIPYPGPTGGTRQKSEEEAVLSMKKLIDYELDGAYHEAGHAIVRAYLKMPFISVTIGMVEGVHAGFTDVVPRWTRTYHDFIDVAMFTAAGRAATDIYTELNPTMTRFDGSDLEDQKAIDAQAQRMGTIPGVDPGQWKAEIFACTKDILSTPYVWEAVEELAWQLLETGGEYAIPAKQVRRILREEREKGNHETKAQKRS